MARSPATVVVRRPPPIGGGGGPWLSGAGTHSIDLVSGSGLGSFFSDEEEEEEDVPDGEASVAGACSEPASGFGLPQDGEAEEEGDEAAPDDDFFSELESSTTAAPSVSGSRSGWSTPGSRWERASAVSDAAPAGPVAAPRAVSSGRAPQMTPRRPSLTGASTPPFPLTPKGATGKRTSLGAALTASAASRAKARERPASASRVVGPSTLSPPVAAFDPIPATPSRPSFSSTTTSVCSQAYPPPERPKGDVAVCARLRPGPRHEMCLFAESPNCVRFRLNAQGRPGRDRPEDMYWCDYAFGPDASQEQVYATAVAPVCEAVLEGYNGAVIAYGQTGSGKTFTIIGESQPHTRGVIPRALSSIFAVLQQRQDWSVEVSALEIYNEKTRDLLSPYQGAVAVDIHEVMGARRDGVPVFACPDATTRDVKTPEEALNALREALRRRETARTDMNHSSSRSHLIFTLTATQNDDRLKATLRGRLHLVDLAGCERLKRSMGTTGGDSAARTPRVKEAGAINKSLTQLALVIYRLTQPSTNTLRHVPYRDSMLTRLLADSFGGSSKTCLIINCSPLLKDREETRCALEFGKRANLVKNVAEINIEMEQEPSDVVKALVAKELGELKREKEDLRGRLQEAASEALAQQRRRAEEVQRLEEERDLLQRRLEAATAAAAEARREAEAEAARQHERYLSMRRCLEALVAETTRTKASKLAMHQQILELMEHSAREDAAYPSELETAKALLQMPEEPDTGQAAVHAMQRLAVACSDSGAASVAPDLEARARRKAGLDEEVKDLEHRWADVLPDRECGDGTSAAGGGAEGGEEPALAGAAGEEAEEVVPISVLDLHARVPSRLPQVDDEGIYLLHADEEALGEATPSAVSSCSPTAKASNNSPPAHGAAAAADAAPPSPGLAAAPPRSPRWRG